MPCNTAKIRHAYKFKHNLRLEKQVIVLMITNDGEKWHYLAVESLCALLRGITSKHGEFYCSNCFRTYTTKDRLKEHKSVCESHDYCYVKMPEEDNKILKYNHDEKFMRASFAIYVDLEGLLEEMSTCLNNPEKSSTTKINKHVSSGYSLLTCSSFDTIENKVDCYRGEYCMKKFCKDLKKHVARIINYGKKKIIPLTSE